MVATEGDDETTPMRKLMMTALVNVILVTAVLLLNHPEATIKKKKDASLIFWPFSPQENRRGRYDRE